MSSDINSDNNKITMPTRLDIEIYIMGENKYDFISFLSDCFKSDFFETLSWGTIKRYQLILKNNDNWISIYFIVITKEQNMYLLLTNFKMYEKRNLLLMFYNINDQKSEKSIDILYQNFLDERNKIFDGILSEDKMNINLKKISTIKFDQKELKNNLKFLIQNEDNLVYKIGISPNLVNKNRKNTKKNFSDTPYEINKEIFFLTVAGENVKTNFQGMITLLIKEHFKYLKFHLNDESILFFNLDNKLKKSTDNKNYSFLLKLLDFFVVLYFAIAFFRFIG